MMFVVLITILKCNCLFLFCLEYRTSSYHKSWPEGIPIGQRSITGNESVISTNEPLQTMNQGILCWEMVRRVMFGDEFRLANFKFRFPNLAQVLTVISWHKHLFPWSRFSVGEGGESSGKESIWLNMIARYERFLALIPKVIVIRGSVCRIVQNKVIIWVFLQLI
jgi:hypothetical protein